MSKQSILNEKMDHPFFRHTDKGTETPVPGTVVNGQIPEWLNGTLTRNGPGIQKVGDTHYDHLFDGLAVLHKFEIKNGKANYQSRALESDAKKQNFAANRIVVGEFGTASFPDPCQSVLGRMQAKFMNLFGKKEMEMTDNCSVNVAYYGDQLYAMTETAFLRRIDPESLKCIGEKTNINKYVALNTATAHPHGFKDGTALNVGNNFRHKHGPQYCFVTIPPSFGSEETAFKNAKIIAEVPSRWKFSPAYFHSFGMTDDKIIFVEAPYCLDLKSLLVASPILNYSYEQCLKWHSGEKAIIHVISMIDGKQHPITYETDAFFAFHHINAFEEDGQLVVDVAAYNDAQFVKSAKHSCIYKPGGYTVEGASARRFVLPLNIEGAKPGENLVTLQNTSATATLKRTGTKPVVDCKPAELTKDWIELPRINYRYNGQKYNYFYGIRTNNPVNNIVPYPNTISKINVTDGTAVDYVSNGIMVSEPIFVSNPTIKDGAEDDGVVLTTVVHKDPKEVDLVVLNAKDMKELSTVKFFAEESVTATFHGIWKKSA